jgi:hypothetical protein
LITRIGINPFEIFLYLLGLSIESHCIGLLVKSIDSGPSLSGPFTWLSSSFYSQCAILLTIMKRAGAWKDREHTTMKRTAGGDRGLVSRFDSSTPKAVCEETEGAPPPSRRFACPYFKNDPATFQTWRSCGGPGWTTIHRLKSVHCELILGSVADTY